MLLPGTLVIGVAKPDLTLKKIPQGFFASYLPISLNSGCILRMMRGYLQWG
jgi:hypothetical protein